LFVLAAFFVAAAIAALAGIKSALSLLITLLAACGTIILRVSSRRMLAGAFASALFHTLISLSVVCHNFPLLEVAQVFENLDVGTNCMRLERYQSSCHREIN
jgi:hypothetical protein